MNVYEIVTTLQCDEAYEKRPKIYIPPSDIFMSRHEAKAALEGRARYLINHTFGSCGIGASSPWQLVRTDDEEWIGIMAWFHRPDGPSKMALVADLHVLERKLVGHALTALADQAEDA